MFELPIVFADIEDLIKLAIVVLFFLGPALGKLLKQQPKPQQRPKPGPPNPPGGGLAGPRPVPPGQANIPAPAGRDALEAEIEEFLKRASGKGNVKRPQQNPSSPERPPVRKPQPQRPAVRQRPLRKPVRDGGSDVGAHVREHIESDPISEHAKQLGRKIGNADERVEGHLHEVFDHDLGQLKKRATSRRRDDVILEGTDDSSWETAEQKRDRKADLARQRARRVAEMLRDPASIHEAVILAEILKPPAD